MSDLEGPDDRDRDDGDAVGVDPISEVEAEVEADLPGGEGDGGGAPPNPRAGRQRFLVAYLRVALVLAFAIGVLELALPEDLRDEAATVMVAIFVAAPLGRVAWLMVRWIRRTDWRFAAVGVLLLCIVASGFVVR